MTDEQRQSLVEKTAKLMYQLESGIDAAICETNWPREGWHYRQPYVKCADAVLTALGYFALAEVAEAALDVLKDVPDAIGLSPCDEDDMDRAQDMKAQITYAEVALDALRAALAKVQP